MTFKRSLLPLLFFVLIPFAAGADTDDEVAAKFKAREALAHNIANVTLSILQDQKKAYGDREALLQRGIFNMVDIERIARLALGTAWKTASDAQRERYTALYGQYLAKMYISNFVQSSERKIQDIKILGIADSQENSFIARTEVVLSTHQDLRVDYLVSEQDDTHKIIDITVEGISLLASHRAEFSRMTASGGVDAVIAQLEQRVKTGNLPMQLSMQSEDVAQSN